MWEGTAGGLQPDLLLVQGQLWGQTRLLRALPSRVLETSKVGGSTASPGILYHCWTVLMVGIFLLISSLNVPHFSLYLMPVAPLCRSCLHHLHIHLATSSPLKFSLLQPCTPRLPSQAMCSTALCILVAFCWTHSHVSLSLLFWGLKTGCNIILSPISRRGVSRAEQRGSIPSFDCWQRSA